MNLCCVNRIAHVVTGPVRNKFDKVICFPKTVKHGFYDLEVCALIVTAYIVNLTYGSLVNNHVYGTAMVLNIEPVAHIFTLAVYGNLFVLKSPCNHKRDELFWKMVRSVVV